MSVSLHSTQKRCAVFRVRWNSIFCRLVVGASFEVHALDARTLLRSAATLRVCSVPQAGDVAHCSPSNLAFCSRLFASPSTHYRVKLDLYSYLKTTTRFSRLPVQHSMVFGLTVLLRYTCFCTGCLNTKQEPFLPPQRGSLPKNVKKSHLGNRICLIYQ